MVGFGFIDNTVMIRAGDAIDNNLGEIFVMSTLTAAALGQVISDSSGVLFGNTLDAFFSKIGVLPPAITMAQRQLRSFRIATTLGATTGVIFGCCLGMLNLLVMDLDARERAQRQKELNTIYTMVMERGPEMFDCVGASLFLHDEESDTLWSKTVRGTKNMIQIPVKDHGLTSWVLRNGEKINTPDAYLDDRFDSSVDKRIGFKTTSVLAYPIIYEDKCKGVLMMLNKRNGPFDDDDENLASVLSKHVAIFMDKFQADTNLTGSQAVVFDESNSSNTTLSNSDPTLKN